MAGRGGVGRVGSLDLALFWAEEEGLRSPYPEPTHVSLQTQSEEAHLLPGLSPALEGGLPSPLPLRQLPPPCPC